MVHSKIIYGSVGLIPVYTLFSLMSVLYSGRFLQNIFLYVPLKKLRQHLLLLTLYGFLKMFAIFVVSTLACYYKRDGPLCGVISTSVT